MTAIDFYKWSSSNALNQYVCKTTVTLRFLGEYRKSAPVK